MAEELMQTATYIGLQGIPVDASVSNLLKSVNLEISVSFKQPRLAV